jgi:hypothetical protein
MKKILSIAMLFVFSFGIISCVAPSPEENSIRSILKKAEMHRKMASRNHVEFRFTKKYIKNGYKALKKGNYKKAKAFATKALTQAKRAMIQKKISDKNWKLALPK